MGEKHLSCFPLLSGSSSWVSLLHLSLPCVLQGESWRRQSSHLGILCHLPSPWILATASDTLCLGPPFCCRFLLEVEGEWQGGCWSGGPKTSLTTPLYLPYPHPPRPWYETCRAPQPLAFLSKFLPHFFLLDLLLKHKTFNKTQTTAAKSLFPSFSLRPSQKRSSW